MTDIPGDAFRARQMYAEGATTRAIYAETEFSTWRLYFWVDGGPMRNGSRLLPAIPRRRVVTRRRILKSERIALVARMMRAAERQVGEIEQRLAAPPREPQERDRDARTLSVLVRTLRELTALDALHDSGDKARTQSMPEDDDSFPTDPDELRRELARRIDRLRSEHAAAVSGEPSSA